MRTIGQSEFLESLFSQQVETLALPGLQSQLQLAKVATEDKASRAWRITFSRLDRNDNAAPLVTNAPPGSPISLFADASYSYAAGANELSVFGTLIPPRRTNPIFGVNVPSNGASPAPVFCQINWGMAQGKANRMIAHWPCQGASIVVEASYVEVFGGVFTQTLGTPPIATGEFPKLAAHVTPVDGLAVIDGGELSIQQRVAIPPKSATAPAVLSTDGAGMAGFAGFVGAPGTPAFAVNSSLPTSVVYNTAPFLGWQATVRSRDRVTTRQLVIFTANTAPQFELRDGQVPDNTGAFVASPGNVGVVYRSDGVTGMKTVAQLEALIDSSTLIQMVSGGVNPLQLVFAGYTTNGATHAPTNAGRALATIGAPTQGGAVFVPDFARRVRVNAVVPFPQFAGVEYRVPDPGPPPIQLVWYDDNGRVCDAAWQGWSVDTLRTTNLPIFFPVEWHPVPARAVMLGIYGALSAEDGADLIAANAEAFVHWRLAP